MLTSRRTVLCRCLTECLVDDELLSMRSFQLYSPPDGTGVAPGDDVIAERLPRHMVLDATTLSNLEMLANSSEGSSEGTLLEALDHCVTPFGRRLFKQWLCAPLCNVDAINARLDAVEDLHAHDDVTADVRGILRKLPDLEKQLNRIHTLGSLRRSQSHPDSRAVMFEAGTYNKRKIDDFLSTLSGFRSAQKIIELFGRVTPNFK